MPRFNQTAGVGTTAVPPVPPSRPSTAPVRGRQVYSRNAYRGNDVKDSEIITEMNAESIANCMYRKYQIETETDTTEGILEPVELKWEAILNKVLAAPDEVTKPPPKEIDLNSVIESYLEKPSPTTTISNTTNGRRHSNPHLIKRGLPPSKQPLIPHISTAQSATNVIGPEHEFIFELLSTHPNLKMPTSSIQSFTSSELDSAKIGIEVCTTNSSESIGYNSSTSKIAAPLLAFDEKKTVPKRKRFALKLKHIQTDHDSLEKLRRANLEIGQLMKLECSVRDRITSAASLPPPPPKALQQFMSQRRSRTSVKKTANSRIPSYKPSSVKQDSCCIIC